MALTLDIKVQIAQALIEQRKNYTGSDIAFANRYLINASVYSQIKTAIATQKHADLEGKIKDANWVALGVKLGVQYGSNDWKTVTNIPIYQAIKKDLTICKKYSRSMLFVDECELGKTHSARHLAQRMQNVFYVDCSQCKAKRDFIRAIATAVGVEDKGKLKDISRSVIFALHGTERPLVILDEAGDLDYPAWMEIKAFWNALEGRCGWYMMGADGLAAKIEAGIQHRRVGFREIFSRFGSKVTSILPPDKGERMEMKKQILEAVLAANVDDKSSIGTVVRKTMAENRTGHTGLLRRAQTLLDIEKEKGK